MIKPRLVCWNCGFDDLMITPTVLEPIVYHGDKLIFTVCPKCWQPCEFVNERPARIVIYPVIKDVELKTEAPNQERDDIRT